MSKYVDRLRERPQRDLCALGKILENDPDEYEAIVEAIFARIDDGNEYPIPWLVDAFKEPYGWSEHFFRRHRNGECQSCRNRK